MANSTSRIAQAQPDGINVRELINNSGGGAVKDKLVLDVVMNPDTGLLDVFYSDATIKSITVDTLFSQEDMVLKGQWENFPGYGPLRVSYNRNVVHIDGVIRRTNAGYFCASGTKIALLPKTLYPLATRAMTASVSPLASFTVQVQRIEIAPDGFLRTLGDNYFSNLIFDGMSWAR